MYQIGKVNRSLVTYNELMLALTLIAVELLIFDVVTAGNLLFVLRWSVFFLFGVK